MEKKDIRQFLHYYIGQKCVLVDDDSRKTFTLTAYNYNYYRDFLSHIQPILTRLKDITDEDAIVLVKLSAWKQYGGHPNDRTYKTYRNSFGQIVVSWGEGLREKNVPTTKEVFSPEEFDFLLSKGYDLFNLIPEGLAIDKETLNP